MTMWLGIATRHGRLYLVPILSSGLARTDAYAWRQRSDGKMTDKITGCAASHDDNAIARIAGESVEDLGERITHLRIEIDSLGATQCDHRDSIGYSRRQNIRVHRVFLLLLAGSPRRVFKFQRAILGRPSQLHG